MFLRGRHIYSQTQINNLKPHTVSCYAMTLEILCVLFKGSRWALVWKTYLRWKMLLTTCFICWWGNGIRKQLFIQFTFRSSCKCFDCKGPRNNSEIHLWSRRSWVTGLFLSFPFFFPILFWFLLQANRVAATAAAFPYWESWGGDANALPGQFAFP